MITGWVIAEYFLVIMVGLTVIVLGANLFLGVKLIPINPEIQQVFERLRGFSSW